MKPLTLAAIDIGSNGARLLIKRFDDSAAPDQRIQKLLFVRIPLRLGKDVFSLGEISKRRQHMMLHMMKGFKQFMLLFRVDEYRAYATAAMRDAENGREMMKKIFDKTGISLKIIPGKVEARLLCNNIIENQNGAQGNFAYIDVGGGSTEISLLHDGVLAESHSFDIGTLRLLGRMVTDATKRNMVNVLMRYAKKYNNVTIIGSGGNINRLYKLTHDKADGQIIRYGELEDIYDKLSVLSIDERKSQYGLKDDRADVIVPAAEIFLTACRALQCDTILVPTISLADSIVDGLYRELAGKD